MGNASSTRKVDVTFHESGRIDLSARVCRCLSIASGDIIDVWMDMDSRELYLYVAKRRDERHNTMASYRNEVKECKRGCKYLRVQSKQITGFVNRLTHSRKSGLFVGNPTTVQHLGRLGVPLIYGNNQCHATEQQEI